MTMFESSHPFAFFDYFRVSYQVRPPQQTSDHDGSRALVRRLQAIDQSGRAGRSLLWVDSAASPAIRSSAGKPGQYQLRNFRLFGRVLPDAAVPGLLQGLGSGWQPREPICDRGQRPVAAIWQDREGSLFLPFDPGEVMLQFWSEEYRKIGRPALAAAGQAAARRSYYRLRPALPRRFQLRLRRSFAQVQARSSFPGWPIEASLHNFYTWLIAAIAEVAGRPVPFLDVWPDGRSCALVLTHDVETEAGYRDMALLRDPERELGYRSSWNFAAQRYQVHEATVRELHDEECEVGVHGLRHDGRDLAPRRQLKRRLPVMREYARRWDAVGFRSPSTQRDWGLMPKLGFEYDSSYSDTDPYEPQPGGCCTYLPYFNERLVELPITLPQDHTMFSVLQVPDTDIWLRKAEFLREHHAMVLVLTHPDYARNQSLAEGYRELLGKFHGDDTVWHALPSEVAAWWRQRAASTIRVSDDGWTIDGPAAARGRVRFATPEGFYPSHQC
jgi:hypothetical protein